jgi:hypothetical protein
MTFRERAEDSRESAPLMIGFDDHTIHQIISPERLRIALR